jgi:hypothetical protein
MGLIADPNQRMILRSRFRIEGKNQGIHRWQKEA